MNSLSAVLNLLLGVTRLQFGDWGFPEAVDFSVTSFGIHIPEPSTLGLAALGLAAIAAMRRRK